MYSKLIYALNAFLLSIFTFLLSSQSATAVVIDFESLYSNVYSIVMYGDTYNEKGFTFTKPDDAFEFGVIGDNGNPNYTGSTVLINFTRGSLTTLTNDNGGLFSIYSIDLNEYTYLPDTVVKFTGKTSSDQTDVQEFILDGDRFVSESFFFNTVFTNLKELSWIQNPSTNYAFDNLNLGLIATPIPAALPLFATGLLGFGVTAYRRRKKSV